MAVRPATAPGRTEAGPLSRVLARRGDAAGRIRYWHWLAACCLLLARDDVRHQAGEPAGRYQDRPGSEPAGLPAPRAPAVGSGSIRAASGPGGRLLLPDGDVLRGRQVAGDSRLDRPAAVAHRIVGGGLPRGGPAGPPAGHRHAGHQDRGRAGVRAGAARADAARRQHGGAAGRRDDAASADPAGADAAARRGTRPARPDQSGRPVGGRGRAMRRNQRGVGARRAGAGGDLHPDRRARLFQGAGAGALGAAPLRWPPAGGPSRCCCSASTASRSSRIPRAPRSPRR